MFKADNLLIFAFLKLFKFVIKLESLYLEWLLKPIF